MERLELLERATRLAHEQVDNCSALSDGEYASLDLSDQKAAITQIAHGILEEAAFEVE